MRYLYSCPLRWSDMDANGHVNNAVFVRYLEEARIDYMRRLAPGGDSAAFKGGSVVARHEVDYLRQLVYRPEPVTVELWVKKISAASLTVGYEVKDADTVYLRAATVVVPFDFAAGRPRRLMAEEKAILKEYLDDAAHQEGAVAG
ncbi:acyl-CoA thioesterase [Streptomyces sp. NPDC056149]|uniref:acyl-CoA thioesterase n=1 Tax=unclassified Streptomyces TaxID=2593676 RepID=UPI0023811ECB|nr:thioesterase family protein [Streptomyces sp. WZ-12]